MSALFLVIAILIVFISYRIYQHLTPTRNIDPTDKYVLISGCDSGFGHDLAIDLDRHGFSVLAGVYSNANVESLGKLLSKRATVFPLDITSEESIRNAEKLIRTKTTSIHALVNNAGIGKGGYIDWTSLDLIRQTMEVNFFGHVAMTKTFLPFLITKDGSRVVNISSVAGYFSGPGISAYASSKFALEAFSDSLRREMAPTWGLHVSIIEPGFMRTPIIDGLNESLLSLWNSLNDEVKKRWGEQFFQRFYHINIKSPFLKYAEDPAKVINALRHAVMNSSPKIRYRPGWQSSLFFFPLSLLPASISDQVFSMSRSTPVRPAGVLQRS